MESESLHREKRGTLNFLLEAQRTGEILGNRHFKQLCDEI